MKRFGLILFVLLSLLINSNHNVVKATDFKDNESHISFIIEVLSWDKVNKIIPIKTVFTIVDVETGKQFKVQRRAGNMHADVQPLSKKDTKVMKEIYKGKWSWKRRAIIIQTEDKLIAGSMHGMPHGAGALQNGFPGHFCIHFLGSTTHKTQHTDISHKLMTLKAGGKLDDYLNKVAPYELLQVFVTALNQEDLKIMEKVVSKKMLTVPFFEALNQLSLIEVLEETDITSEENAELFMVNIPVKVKLYKKDNTKEERVLHFIITRNNPTDRWYIDSIQCLSTVNCKE